MIGKQPMHQRPLCTLSRLPRTSKYHTAEASQTHECGQIFFARDTRPRSTSIKLRDSNIIIETSRLDQESNLETPCKGLPYSISQPGFTQSSEDRGLALNFNRLHNADSKSKRLRSKSPHPPLLHATGSTNHTQGLSVNY